MDKDNTPNVNVEDINIPNEEKEGDLIKNQVKDLTEGKEIEDSPENDEEEDDVWINEDGVEKEAGDDDNDETDEESDDEESDDEDLKKFDVELKNNILNNYHPSTKQISYEEVLALSKITRNNKGLIIDPFHTTIPILTRYEFAKVIGLRAKQLNHGATPFIDNLDPDIIDGYTIAMKEFELKKIPFIIKRPLPNGINEYWNVKDLEYIQ